MNAFHFPFQRTALSAALLAAFACAQAAEGEDAVMALVTPQSTMSLGAGYVDRDNFRFGQYTGMTDAGIYGLFDLNLVRRNGATGTWLRLDARNLGLDSRSLFAEHHRQGDWRYFLEHRQLPRHSPYLVSTGLLGIGTDKVTIVPVAAGSGTPVRLQVQRKASSVGFDKAIGRGFDLQLRFSNEDKEGTRLFGRAGPNFLADPVQYNTRQWEAILNYTGEALQLAAGYYGTNFVNAYNALFINGEPTAGAAFNPIALPPSSDSHQLYLAGAYAFTPTTQSNFKIAQTRASQDEAFILAPAPQVGRSGLGGEVRTTLAQFGLSARPLPKLSLLANLRYEDRDDKTPVEDYFQLTSTPTSTGENEPRSLRHLNGKLEGSYLLPYGLRLTAGADYDEKKRNTSEVRVVSFRERTEETTYRVELRRSLSATVNGAVSLARTDRRGSDFQATVLSCNANAGPFVVAVTCPAGTASAGRAASNLVAPLHLADRERDRLRLFAEWLPTEALALQVAVDDARDDYTQRTALELGPRKGKARLYSLDAAYTLSERWQLSAWASRDDTQADNASRAGTGQLWVAKLRNVGQSFGLGLRGKPMTRLELGSDLQLSYDRGEYQLRALTGGDIPSLPDNFFRRTVFKLFAKYAVQKNVGLRLDYVHDRFSTDDWTWTNWTYADGTRVMQDTQQKVNFFGVSGYYKWW